MSKRKKIEPGEEFQMGDKVFMYSILESGNITLKLIPINETNKPKPNKTFIPPTICEVKAFFKAKGYSEEGAQKAFDHYELGEPPWTDTHGTPVRAWKQKMNTNWLKPEYLIKPSGDNGFKFQE